MKHGHLEVARYLAGQGADTARKATNDERDDKIIPLRRRLEQQAQQREGQSQIQTSTAQRTSNLDGIISKASGLADSSIEPTDMMTEINTVMNRTPHDYKKSTRFRIVELTKLVAALSTDVVVAPPARISFAEDTIFHVRDSALRRQRRLARALDRERMLALDTKQLESQENIEFQEKVYLSLPPKSSINGGDKVVWIFDSGAEISTAQSRYGVTGIHACPAFLVEGIVAGITVTVTESGYIDSLPVCLHPNFVAASCISQADAIDSGWSVRYVSASDHFEVITKSQCKLKFQRYRLACGRLTNQYLCHPELPYAPQHAIPNNVRPIQRSRDDYRYNSSGQHQPKESRRTAVVFAQDGSILGTLPSVIIISII